MSTALIVLIPAAIIFLIDSLALSHYWQLKEYRRDRMWDFLRYDEGKLIATSPHNLLIYGALIIGLFDFLPIIAVLAAIILIKLWPISQIGIKRPVFTQKGKLLVAGSIITSIIIFFLFGSKLATVTIALQPITVSIIVAILKIPTQRGKNKAITRATKKIQSLSELKSIAITGSYGKSSTKEFIAQIVSQEGYTLKTPGNINTEIGVAQLINKKLKQDHEFFVVEMGAYKEGEIALLTKMVQPNIGIITAIAPQHLSLFGSLEAIKEAKAEIVRNLPENGIAILNGDNEHCRSVGKSLKNTETHYYSLKSDSDASCKLLKKEQSGNSYKLTIKVLETEFQTEVSFPAPHFIGNLLAAVLASHLSGISLEQIQAAIPKLELPENGFKTIKNPQGINVIDDSYNANPDGLKEAISALNKLPGNKFIVTMGMAELGRASQQAHEEVAKLILESEIHCFVTKKIPFQFFTKTAKSVKKDPKKYFTYIKNLKEVSKVVTLKLQPGDSILLANRVPQSLKAALNI